MRKNLKKFCLVIIVVLIIIIILFFIKGRDTTVSDKPKSSNTRDILYETHPSTISMQQQSLPDGMPPEWVQSLMELDSNNTLAREKKIQQLVHLLKQNNENPQAITGILISLTMLNPIEVIDEIIPYLKYKDVIVQSAAIGALNNASLLTPKEHDLKQSLPENADKRERIANAINELKQDHHLPENVKQALVSSYAATNPSLEDTKIMIGEILNRNNVTPNEASYIASSVLNGKDLLQILDVLATKDSHVKDSIISSIGASIIENPQVTSVLSSQQKILLESFIRSNPPQSYGNNFGYQNDQWKYTLNVLNGNI